MRVVLLVLISIHGLLHLLGFIKAFKLARLDMLPHPISRINGIFWLISAGMVVTTGILFYLFVEGWWIMGLASVIISEYVILQDFEDAGLGSGINILIFLISVIGLILSYL